MKPYITIARGAVAVEFFADEDGCEVERTRRKERMRYSHRFPRRRADDDEIEVSGIYTAGASASDGVETLRSGKAPVRLTIGGVDRGDWRITRVTERWNSAVARTNWDLELEAAAEG